MNVAKALEMVQWNAEILTFQNGKTPNSEQMLVRFTAHSNFRHSGFKILGPKPKAFGLAFKA